MRIKDGSGDIIILGCVLDIHTMVSISRSTIFSLEGSPNPAATYQEPNLDAMVSDQR